MGKISKLLRSGRHHRIEQFTVMFVVLAVSILSVTGVCFVSFLNQQNNILAEKAIYMTKFQTSRTQVQGTVEGVYTSDDRTKTLVLLKFENMTNMSVNADNYKLFLSNAKVNGNGGYLRSAPSGSIYLFGNSGYMGVYLVDKKGFPSQVLDLVVRCNVELKAAQDTSKNEKEMEDASFEKYDQFRVYVNPATTEAKKLDCLNKNEAPTVLDMYNQAVVVTEEKNIHDKLEAALESMRISLNQIQEYSTRLSGTDGVNVPDRPASIKGDEIEQVTAKDGKKILVYKPKTVVSGGWNFDWRAKSVTEGWLDDLIKSSKSPNMTYDQYFTQMSRLEKDGTDNVNIDVEWTLTDGTLVKDMDKESTKAKLIDEHIAALKTAYGSYFAAKKNYQRSLLGSLLHLEADASIIGQSASINTSADVIKLY